jgi:hypothetical protein
MSNYDNTNRGAIWKNEKKQTEKHPDFTGDLNVDGVIYNVSAWKRKPDANPKAPLLSFSVSKREVPQEVRQAVMHSNHGRRPAPQPAPAYDDFEDATLPF